MIENGMMKNGMIIATRKECIKAARLYIKRLGKARGSLSVMGKQLRALQRELDRMDGLGSSGNFHSGGHTRGAGGSPVEALMERRERIRGQMLEIKRKQAALESQLMNYEQARAGIDEQEARAVHLIDFEGMTQLRASMDLYVSETWAGTLERRGLVGMAMILLGMMDEKTAKELHWNEIGELMARRGADREQPAQPGKAADSGSGNKVE